jgi:hypothetical protein
LVETESPDPVVFWRQQALRAFHASEIGDRLETGF